MQCTKYNWRLGMKKILVLGLAGVLAAQACNIALAGEMQCGKDMGCCYGKCDKGDKSEKWQEKRSKHLSKKLDLSTEQKTRLDAILKEDADAMKPEMEKRREARKAEMEKIQAEMKAHQEALDAKIKDILTPEQSAKFEKMQQERAEKMEKKMKKCHKGDKDQE
jgi:Spy/CpxP family protein refolding chaperone